MTSKKTTDHVPPTELPGRNDPCYCGSGKKYKKCCEEKDASATHATLEKQWTEAEKAAAKVAEDEKTSSPEQSSAPTKPTHQPHVSEHRRNTMTVPKYNMPRKTGGG